MNPKLRKIWKVVSDLLLLLVVVLAILLYGLQFFGLKPYSVLSGSMQSVYPTGSLIYVRQVEPGTLKTNDIITFRMAGGTVATHRIVELVRDESDPDTVRFRTKGDENEVADGNLVNFDSVIGTPVFCIPFLGYLTTYMMQPPGKYIAVTLAVLLIFLEFAISLVPGEKNEKKSQSQKN